MKLLCLIDNLGSGGAQRQLVNLAILWKQRGHEIVFVCYGKPNFYEPLLVEKDIAVHWIRNRNALERIVKVRRFIRKCNPDIVISFLEIPNFLGCVSAIGKHNWKLITSERSAKEASFISMRSRVFKQFERLSDWTVCNSYNAQRMWEQFYPQYKRRISTIYNPVIIPVMQNDMNERKTNRKRIVVAASYQDIKNPINVIEAVRLLSKKEQDALLIDWYGRKEVTTGNTRIADKAALLVAKYNLGECIHLYDATKDIYREMKNADAVGLFSLYEGLPNAICEGMTLGKPILMSKVSDYADLVTEGNGFLCEASDILSIRDALLAFLNTSGDVLESMGTASKAKAYSLFSTDRIIGEWEELFNRLVCKKNGAEMDVT